MSAETYAVTFDSTDDADLDAETTLLEDRPLTLEEIRGACDKYRVRARYRRAEGEPIETYVPANERRAPLGG